MGVYSSLPRHHIEISEGRVEGGIIREQRIGLGARGRLLILEYVKGLEPNIIFAKESNEEI